MPRRSGSLARVFAREGYDLVLVARSRDRLDALARELHDAHGAAARAIPIDLSVAGASRELRERVAREGVEIGVLVGSFMAALFARRPSFSFSQAYRRAILPMSGVTFVLSFLVGFGVTAVALQERGFEPAASKLLATALLAGQSVAYALVLGAAWAAVVVRRARKLHARAAGSIPAWNRRPGRERCRRSPSASPDETGKGYRFQRLEELCAEHPLAQGTAAAFTLASAPRKVSAMAVEWRPNDSERAAAFALAWQVRQLGRTWGAPNDDAVFAKPTRVRVARRCPAPHN